MYSVWFFIIDRIAAWFGRFFLSGPRKESVPDLVSTILVSKYLGAGSVIAAVPLLSALRRRYPEAKIVLLTTGTVVQMAEILDVFDRIEIISPMKPFSALLTLLKLRKCVRANHTLVIDLELHSYFSHVLSAWFGGSYSAGLAMPYERVFWNYVCRCETKSPLHSCYDKVAEHLGAKIELSTEKPGCRITDSKRLVIAPFCSKLSLRRKWEEEKWSEFISLFLEKYGSWQVDIIGTPSDRDEAMKIIGAVPENLHHKVSCSCGRLKLKDAFALIREAGLFVSIDSAPLHFARLVGVPSVSLWGATEPGMLLRPMENCYEVQIFHREPCSPCVHRKKSCPAGRSCVGNISAAEVMAAAEKVLSCCVNGIEEN